MTVQTANYYEAVEHLPPGGILLFTDVAWEEYEELLEAVGEKNSLRVSYDAGRLQIMALSAEHEKYQFLINNLVNLLSVRLRIKVLCFGSATMKKKPRGVEPDLEFYVQTADALGARSDIDFSVDPPPDIIVEVDLQHQSLFKFPIYASFGVLEIWRYDGQSMTMYKLDRGEYVETDGSVALPILSCSVLTEFLTLSKTKDHYETLLAFEEWLQTKKP